MIKLIIFDLDGVLVDAKEIHYESLNMALSEIGSRFIINRDEHISRYDGLPTKQKLKLLSEDKGLSSNLYDTIWKSKQLKTIDIIKEKLTIDHRLRSVLKQLKEDGYIIYVASNSIRETLQLMLYKTGLIEFVDYFFSNEDVKNPKPNPEIYLKSMSHAGVSPKETLIVEDSIHGRESAIESGAVLCAVNKVDDVTYDKIKNTINNNTKKSIKKWESDDIIVLIPMAGAGSRFQSVGYTFPKPLIEVRNKPMIQLVVDNLNIKCKFVYIVQESHYEKYNLKYLLNLITPNCEILTVNGVTEGAACTTLIAKELIDNDKHLIIANSDQFIEWNSLNFYYLTTENHDGTILTFESTHPKWSFVREENNLITEIAEKKPISNIATVGIYHWKKGSDYVKYAEKMISSNKRVNNEFYVAPVYNEAIDDGLKIKKFTIDKMWGIGTPEDLNYFLENYNGEI
jgi:HAD superfamily hydrolase (TIGR01509 family)